MADLSGLEISGRLVSPEDSDWDAARAAWNLAADQRPLAVAFAADAADVAAVVSFAARRGLRVAPQGTGHGAAPLAALDGAILLKTERLRRVEVDPGTRTARVEAGVLAAELGEAAQAHGLSALPGSSPDVGTIGYTLGGGLSWLGRRYGFACNRVRAIELVTAAGEPRTVDAESDADLFWALRGGGGGYAVVTALRTELVPIDEVYAGALLLPAEVGAEGVRAYRDWAAGAPEEITSIVRFLTPPDIPDVPAELRGRKLLTIGAACIGGQAESEAAIAPLREIGEPVLDTFAQIPAAGLSRIHMDPEQPVPGIGDGHLLAELPDEAIETLAGAAGPDSGSPLLLTELRQLGGALGRPAEGGGALAAIDAGYAMYSVGMPVTPELARAVPAHMEKLAEAMRPWIAEGGYYNFTERPCDVEAILPAEVCERLAAVRRRWDPDERILASHAVAPAPA